MKKQELRQFVANCCNDIIFKYNNMPSGITAEVSDYIPVCHMWYGNISKDYSDVDELINDDFFDGKTLNEIVDDIDIELV